jgi:hypothetical protein
VANQAALPVSISGLSATFTNRTLFSGLTLTPGTYYIVLARTTTNSLVVQGSSTPTVTLGSGVVDRGEGIAFSLAAYPPASGFIPSPVLQVPTNIFISITGDLAAPSAIPATSPLVLLLTGLAVVGLFTARHKFARRGKLTR